MKAWKFATCVGLAAVLALFFAFAAHADLYFEYENVSKGMPHQQDGKRLQKNYLTAAASRIEMGDGKVIIVDYKSPVIYTLTPLTRSYTQVSIDEVPGAPSNASPAEKEQLGRLMGGMMQMKVASTEENKTIEGYKCRKYLVDIALAQGVYWVSKDVPGYLELRSIGSRLAGIAKKNPMLRQMHVAAIVDKLDGFPVQIANSVMGGTITSTLKKVEQRPLDPALFKVPKDFSLRGK